MNPQEQIINLDNLSIIELKAMIYDCNATIVQVEKNMGIINDAIIKKVKEGNSITKTEATEVSEAEIVK